MDLNNKDDIVAWYDENPGKCSHVSTDAIVIDLMSVIRKFTAIDLTNVKTFGDICQTIINVTVKIYGDEINEVHLVLENYTHESSKSNERLRRGSKENMVGCMMFCQKTSHCLTWQSSGKNK